MRLWFLAGCGGHWLMFLIRSLRANNLEDLSPYSDSFHATLPTAGPLSATHNASESQMFFNADAVFNVYLNLMKKAKMNLDGIPFSTRDITDQYEIMASAASAILDSASAPMDLNFNDIFLNQDKFINDLFFVLDKHGLEYHKNREIAHQAMVAYRNTCVDPGAYFNNLDNPWWLGWCMGIEKHVSGNWPLIYSFDQAQDFVRRKADYYSDFTHDKVIFFNER